MIPFVIDLRSAETAAEAIANLPPPLWASEPCWTYKSAVKPWSIVVGVPESLCRDLVPDARVMTAIAAVVARTDADWNEEIRSVLDLELPNCVPTLPTAMIDGVFGMSRGLARRLGLRAVEDRTGDVPLPTEEFARVCTHCQPRW